MSVSTTRSELLKKRVDRFTRVLHAVEQGTSAGCTRRAWRRGACVS